jgi:hypothetical protein
MESERGPAAQATVLRLPIGPRGETFKQRDAMAGAWHCGLHPHGSADGVRLGDDTHFKLRIENASIVGIDIGAHN